MSTVIEQPSTELAIIEAFELTKQQIAEAVELANEATVIDHEDTEGMKLCHDYRMGLVKMRTGIEAKRKELKEDIVKRGKLIDGVAKELSAPLPAAEARLKELEESAKREAERIEAIKQEEIQREVKRRCELATAVAWSIPIAMLTTLTTEEFETAYGEKLAEKEAREEAQRKEQERQEAIAKEQAEKAAELARKEAEIAAKQKAIEDAAKAQREKQLGWRTMALARQQYEMPVDEMMALSDEEFEQLVEAKRAELDERRIEEAKAEEARLEREAKELSERIEREAAAKAERLEQERVAEIARAEEEVKAAAEKEARKAARAPDREKIAAYGSAIGAIPFPKLSKASKHYEERIHQAYCDLVNTLYDIRGELA